VREVRGSSKGHAAENWCKRRERRKGGGGVKSGKESKSEEGPGNSGFPYCEAYSSRPERREEKGELEKITGSVGGEGA